MTHHPLTPEDCTAMRRLARPAVIIGAAILVFLTIHQLVALEMALAAATGV
ncbi:hypothetical protein [uncultured Martelella sp.]|uniref:hypothetical protein n=1 Tax=uncultured Martelella sp. TaxID=392331 RepID=UPI0029C8E4F2|nr:hypothetical protein [uncultured Martelella sp.]